MGMQQILLVLLSVIIVGIAIATGISLMNYQAKVQNRQAIISDMHYVAAQAFTFYKLPNSFGGGDGTWDKDKLMSWEILPLNEDKTRYITKNGEIEIEVIDSGHTLLITGYGYELGLDNENGVQAQLNFQGANSELELEFIN